MAEPAAGKDLEAMRAITDERIAHHAHISSAMTAERTALESQLIPVSAYILISAIECWFRHPEMMRTIDAAMPAEDIGRAGRHPGMRVNAVHLWSIANIYLIGRKVMTGLEPGNDPLEPTHTVLDFWERAALAYRGDGKRQAWDAGFVLRPYGDDVVSMLADGATPVDTEEERTRIGRFLASLTSYLFLLYFDTRVGTGDTGPYPLPDGRTLLVRDLYQMTESDFWWSDVAKDVPYRNLTAGLVLDGVDVKVNDWGTSITTPEDYLAHLVGFSLFTTDTPDRSLRAVPLDELDGILAEVRRAQAQHYRNVAAMTRDEKIRCGAYVYFSFLRPFAEVAGVADQLDWSMPRDTPEPLYAMLAAYDGQNDGSMGEGDYYAPLAR